MRPPESLTSPSTERASVASAWLPSVPGILTADQILATGQQHRRGAAARRRDRLARRPCRCLEPRRVRDGAERVRAPRRGAARLRMAARPPSGRTGRGRSVPPMARPSTTRWRATTPPTARSGCWHELQVTRDDAFVQRMWPVARKGIEFALGLQQPRGEIIWQRRGDGTPGSYALLTGSSSMHHALRCAIALAEYVGEPQPDWELAAGQLGHAVACHPEAFADKSRYSMDWYYPVLGGPLRGRRRRRAAGGGLGHVRGARPRHQVRQRPALGHRGGDLRARARARRDRRSLPRP